MNKGRPFFSRFAYEMFILFRNNAGKPLFIGLAVAVVLGLVLGGLTEGVLEKESIVRVDNWVLNHTYLVQSPGLTRAMIIISSLGGGYFVWPVTIILAALLVWKRRPFEARFTAAAMGGGGVLNLVLKGAIRRARPVPPGGTELVQAWGWAYPSGHAFLSVVFYFTIAYFIFRRFRTKKAGFAAFAAAFCLVCAIALSRVYLQVHYLSDILAGLLAGIIWFAVCLAILEYYRGKA